MRMIFTPVKSKALGLCMLLCALFFSNTARAVDWTDLSGLTEYTPASYELYFKYTAEETGTLVISGYGSPWLRQYTDETATTMVEMESSVYSDNTTYQTQYLVDVTTGETYYFQYRQLEENKTITFSMMSPETTPELIWQYPDEENGYKLDVNYYGYIAFKFNISVTFDETIVLQAPDYDDAYQEVTANYAGGYYNVTTKYILYDWLTSEIIQPGARVTLTLTNVTATKTGNLYGNDGTLVLTFYAPSIPTQAVTIDFPEKFYSWWDEGDATGYAKITFDNELLPSTDSNQLACASLGYGSREYENEYYYEDLPVTIDGNTAIVDFTGKSRTRSEMLPNSSTQYDEMLLIVHLIKDINGEYCYSEGSGSVASYQAFIPYEDIGGNPAGIKAVTAAETATDVYYNVAGQRVATPTKGLYINGGKKVVVK